MNKEETKKNIINFYNQILDLFKINKNLTLKEACFIANISYRAVYNYRLTNRKLYNDFRQKLSKLKNNDNEVKKNIVKNYEKMISLAKENKELTERKLRQLLGISFYSIVSNKKKFPDFIKPFDDRLKKIRRKNIKEIYKKNKGQKRKEYKKREKKEPIVVNKYQKLKQKVNEKEIKRIKKSFFLIKEALRIENFKQRFFLNCQHSQSIKEIIKKTDETYPFFYKCMLHDREFALNVKEFLKNNKMFDNFNLSYLDSSI